MSIRMRLLLSYIGMTFIPVVLFAMVAAGLISVFFSHTAGSAGGNGPPLFGK
ncbi:hypothetical protein LJK88_11335 [Paenibacillus sp. P26]|nr:hypothetical protein LJK88_11335 [Paenibacillus sp. P26]